MRVTQLGGSGCAVSALSFGAAGLGNLLGEVSDADAREAVDAAGRFRRPVPRALWEELGV